MAYVSEEFEVDGAAGLVRLVGTDPTAPTRDEG
jgi:hypothetical protein